jgi:hypothetical protein
MTEKKKDTRARHWSFIVYPESAPENWIELLKSQMLTFAVSPLHDKDLCESPNSDGVREPKKPHYHVFMCFEGKKSYEQVKTITDSLQATIPQAVVSAKGLIRYFVHKDDPNKYQYDIKDIFVYGDIDIITPFQTSSSRYEAIREMLIFVDENGIMEFQDLMNYAMFEREDWFRYLCDSCAYIVQEYIKSARHRSNRS